MINEYTREGGGVCWRSCGLIVIPQRGGGVLSLEKSTDCSLTVEECWLSQANLLTGNRCIWGRGTV